MFDAKKIKAAFAELQQSLLELAYKHGADNDLYRLAVRSITEMTARGHLGEPDPEEKSPIGLPYLFDEQGNHKPFADIDRNDFFVLAGSHAFCHDQTRQFGLQYTKMNVNSWARTLNTIYDEAERGELVTGVFRRLSREEQRTVKVRLSDDPTYYHPTVIPFVQAMFGHRVSAHTGPDGAPERIPAERFNEVLEAMRLNFLTYSYGGLVLRQTMNCLAEYMESLQYSPAEIQRAFEQVLSVEVAPNYRLNADSKAYHYHQTVMASPNDWPLIEGMALTMKQRGGFETGQRHFQLDERGLQNLVFVDGMPSHVEHDIDGNRLDTYKGHRLGGKADSRETTGYLNQLGKQPDPALATVAEIIRNARAASPVSFAEAGSKITAFRN